MKRDLCRYCRKPMANKADCEAFQPGEGEHLCWHILQNCDQDAEQGIDLRDAEIAKLEGELAAERALPANLLDVHAICDQRDKATDDLHRERALADRLAHWLSSLEVEELVPAEWSTSVVNAIRSWKEARRAQD